jgi:hypothetical protein
MATNKTPLPEAVREQMCQLPPDGWWCSREPGHEGPCAARPIQPNRDAEWLAIWRAVSGPHAQLTGPLIRYAGLVAEAAAQQERARQREQWESLREYFAYGQGPRTGMQAVTSPRCTPSVWKELQRRIDAAVASHPPPTPEGK